MEAQDWVVPGTPAEVVPLGGGLELRRWRDDEDDLDRLTAAVLESLDHLVPWMPWADGFDRSSAAGYLERAQASWDARSEFQYGVREGDDVLGSTGLHARIGVGRLEIGYWVHVERIGEGIARRVAAGLVEQAFSLPSIEAVEIRHDPANVRSGRIPAALAFDHLGVLPIPSTDETVERSETSVWELTRAAYDGGAGRLDA